MPSRRPYQLDARRCIAYLTIEHAGHIDASLRPGIGNRVFGCDDCLAVCPWNKFAAAAQETRLALKDELDGLDLAALARLDDPSFRTLFAGTPVKRTGRDRFLRNVLIAIGNSGRPALIDSALPHLADPSPLVRAMAVWALGRLDAGRARGLATAGLQDETDPSGARRMARAHAPDGRRRMNILILGLGYSAGFFARAALAQGWEVTGTVRSAEKAAELSRDGIRTLVFGGFAVSSALVKAVAEADAVLISVQPAEDGDPALGPLRAALMAAPNLRWIGYLSTIGVYGDQGGGWIDETTPRHRPTPAPASASRSRRPGCSSGATAASPCRSSACRASTAPAATPSPSCAAARRTA